MFLTDTVSVGAVRRTGDGYLVADAKVARTGVQTYLGSEVGRPDLALVRLYRPPEEVFAKDAMHSYAHRPMTLEHPKDSVTAANWGDVSVGQTGSEVMRDGEFVRVPMVLMDAAAITAYEAGTRELSMGYSADIEFVDGVTPDGQQYDAVQRQLRMNHLALVGKARGGEQLRIGDGRTPGEQDRGDNNSPKRNHPMSDTKTILVDGLSVVTTDAGVQAITKLQQQLKDANTAAGAAEAAYQTTIAAKDAAIAKAEGERDAIKSQVLSDADLDKRVQERGDLIAKAKAVHDADYSGKSDADVRKAVVVAKLGDAAVNGKHEAYVEALFDGLYGNAKPTDPVANALRLGDSNTNRTQVNDNGYSAAVAGLDYRTRGQKEA